MNCKKLPSIRLIIVLLSITISTESCYHYRVFTTESNPGTEYQQKTMRSYFWGLVNNPQTLIVPNCNNNNSLDEVVYSVNFGQALVSVITLGIYTPLQVKWRCHKPPVRQGGL